MILPWILVDISWFSRVCEGMTVLPWICVRVYHGLTMYMCEGMTLTLDK